VVIITDTKKETGDLPAGVPPREYSTASLRKRRVKAGDLTETGETFVMKEIETLSGKNGPFYVLKGWQDDHEFELVFSNEYLYKLVIKHWDQIVDKRIIVCVKGTNYDRVYTIAGWD
jgi:hypothetical protein